MSWCLLEKLGVMEWEEDREIEWGFDKLEDSSAKGKGH